MSAPSPSPVQQYSGLLPSPAMASGPTQQSGPAVSTPYPPAIETSGLHPAPMSAISAVSAPISRPVATIASQPPPSLPAYVSPALAVGPTHVSAQRPPGVPTIQEHTPSIQVIDAPRLPGVAHWVVAVVGIVCFGLGLALGLALR